MLRSLMRKVWIGVNVAMAIVIVGALSTARAVDPDGESVVNCALCGACLLGTSVSCPIPPNGDPDCGTLCYCISAGPPGTHCLEL